MQAIGGYFGLEPIQSEKTKPYHKGAFLMNFGRGGFLTIIKHRHYKKIWLPNYNCPCVAEYLTKHNIVWECYDVDKDLNPKLPVIGREEAICYVNYFGIKSDMCRRLEEKGLPLILDLTQAFFYKPFPQTDCFSSVRKFFGVPDGGYLFGPLINQIQLPLQKICPTDCKSLFLRQSGDVIGGYSFFKQQENALQNWLPARASQMTSGILEHIDWPNVISRRKDNFRRYHQAFMNINRLNFNLEVDTLALSYPLQIESITQEIKNALISRKIFVPTFWPGTIQNEWTRQTLFLPCDHRYAREEIESVIEIVLKVLNK